jgi:mannosyltransferase
MGILLYRRDRRESIKNWWKVGGKIENLLFSLARVAQPPVPAPHPPLRFGYRQVQAGRAAVRSSRLTERLLAALPGVSLMRWGLICLVFLGFALRLYHLSYQSLWRDEVDAITFAGDSLPALFADLWQAGFNGPLYHILLHGWIVIAGASEFSVRFLSSLCGTLAIPLVFLLGRRLIGPSPGILAALLVAASPYLVWYSQEAKMYALLVTLVLLALYSYHRALHGEGRRWWIGAVACTSLTFYTHILGALVVPVEALWFLVGWRSHKGQWRGWLAMMAAITLPYLPLALWQFRLFTLSFRTGHPFVPLNQLLLTLLVGWGYGPIGTTSIPLLAFFVFYLLAGAVLRHGRQAPGAEIASPAPYLRPWPAGVIPLLLHLAVPVASLYLISLRVPLFTDRYLIWVAPAFYLLLARGLHEVWQRSPAIAGLSLALILALNARSLWTQTHTPIKSDFRAAAAYLAAHRAETDLVIFLMPPVRRTFDYYFRPHLRRGHGREKYAWADGPYTNNGLSPEDVDLYLNRVTANHPTVWLVSSEPEAWDQRGLTRAWLDKHGELTDSVAFARVSLFRYEKY